LDSKQVEIVYYMHISEAPPAGQAEREHRASARASGPILTTSDLLIEEAT
jgi:hypothetical protein